jgi:hypothetical protein
MVMVMVTVAIVSLLSRKPTIRITQLVEDNEGVFYTLEADLGSSRADA